MNNDLNKSMINNEYDFSNIIPVVEYVSYLIKYCDNVYNEMVNKMNEEEEKNIQFKPEYKEFMYKKNYGTNFEIYIREKTYNNITCKNFNDFKNAVDSGNLKNINGLDIRLNLDFKRGKGDNLEEYENSFLIKFEPYKIIFARKSNYNDSEMNQIESNISDILNKFPVVNSIFCTK